MEKIGKVAVILALAVAFCFTSVLLTHSKPPKQANKGATEQIWDITEAEWVDADNPRFAVYDPGTPEDESDDVVCDRETGLVWERSPSTTAAQWYSACSECYIKVLGGRKGWRLPSIEELSSLVDVNESSLKLPSGHPFINVQSGAYWSATLHAYDVALGHTPERAWFVNFSNGGANVYARNSREPFFWCVRGGQGHIGY